MYTLNSSYQKGTKMGHTAGNKNFQVLEHVEYFIKNKNKNSLQMNEMAILVQLRIR